MTLGQMRVFLGSTYEQRGELLRALTLVGVFRPAGFLLFRWLIKPLAFVFSLLLIFGHEAGRKSVRTFAHAFGLSWFGGLRLSMAAHMNRLCEFAELQRLIRDPTPPHPLTARIDASDEVQRLLASGDSVVMASAHFLRNSAAHAMFSHAAFARHIYLVTAHPPPPADPYLWRVHVQLSQTLKALNSVRPTRLTMIFTGGAFKTLIDDLRGSRSLAYINIDAPWNPNRPSSYTRAFAGAASRTFSTGAAKLSRLTGSPLLLVFPLYDTDGQVRIKVLGPYRSAAAGDDAHDRDVMRQVLDDVEREVGRRPVEYVLDMGSDRRWDAARELWTDEPVAGTQP